MKYGTFLAIVLLAVSSVRADNWPQWRGPAFNGSSVEKNLPDRWNTTENITWSAELPGAAASTPIIWEDRVFLSGVDVAKDTIQAMCFDRADGKLLWQHTVGKGTRRDYRSTYAAASPVTDGKLVIFFYSSGELICFDPEGNRRWARNIRDDYGPFAFQWTFASSPTLFDGRLYVQVLQRDVPVGDRGFSDRVNESYLLAIDPNSGKTLWQQIRPSKAVAESREAFSTPIPLLGDGDPQLLIVGGDALSGHDPATGKELWRWGTWNTNRISHWRLVPSPVAGDGVVLACAPKRSPIYAIKTGGSGVLGDRDVAWASLDVGDVSSDVPTPAFYDGDFFVLSDVRRCLSRVEPRTGKVKWSVPTPGSAKYEASPLAADGRIYTINFDGQVALFNAADGELMNTIPMDEPADGEVVRASIVVSDGQLFLRTTRRLYCVGSRRP